MARVGVNILGGEGQIYNLFKGFSKAKRNQMLSTSSEWNFFKLLDNKVNKIFILLRFDNYCISSCSGVIITSESKFESNEEFIYYGPISKVLAEYKKYKMIEDFPKGFEGS